MQRCIAIARHGLGTTAPNPMVGSVIVYHNTIIGEGYTSAYGGNHAEVNAILSVTKKELLEKSTLYVTLEPCSHYGKTPPCSDFIIKHRIPTIVIGAKDPYSEVAGKGIEKLKASGATVIFGVEEADCKHHHKRFFTFQNKKRPYIILKWAQSTNGFMAPLYKEKQEPFWITCNLSRQLTHKWRTEEAAILVGTTTVIDDNPSLTARSWVGKQPLRIVIDKKNRLSKTYRVFNQDAETLVVSENNVDFKQPLAQQIASLLYTHQILSVIIEGGAKTLQTFINENLWDEARVFTGSLMIKDGLKSPHFFGTLVSEQTLAVDRLNYYTNP